MKNIIVFVTVAFLISLLFFPVAVMAGMRAGAFTLTPHIGGYVFDGAQDINSDPAYGIQLGYNITERLGVEGVFDFVDTDSKSPDKRPEIDAYIYRLDGLYHFMLSDNVYPYVAAGLGAINIDRDPGGDDTEGLFNYGGGLKYFITDMLAIRGDVRHIIDFEGNSNAIYTLGLLFQFGGKVKAPPAPRDSDGDGVFDDMDKCPDTPAGVKVDSEGCPVDSDGDGVYDDMDQCPGTPRGVPVDSRGCPKDSDGDGVYDHMDQCPGTPRGVPVDSRGCPKDSDGDGVYDHMDQCPGTPRGVPVDSRGCPKDSDGDGVYDHMDQCPGTPPGIVVDSVGCPVPIKERVSIELKVEFDTDKAKVKPVYHDHLQKVANFLKAYPDTTAVIEGHTDSVGKDTYNLSLSQKRADSVRKYLIDNLGISPARLTAKGYGEARPIADNKTREGRQRNRRVIAVISTIVTK